MHLLNQMGKILIIFSVALLAGCGQRGPLTPEESFTELKKAYETNSARRVAGILSFQSIQKLNKMNSLFARMNEDQLQVLARQLDTSPEQLKSLTPDGYITLQMKIAGLLNEDVIRQAVSHRIVNTRIIDKRAIIKVENGMELRFVKEGPYWKFDLSCL